MDCYLVPQGIAFLRHGAGAPLWHALATLENAVVINLVSAVIVAACFGFVARRIVFWYEKFEALEDKKADRPLPRAPVSPFLAALSFLLVPSFAGRLTVPSPFHFSLVPVMLSAALVASLNTRVKPPEEGDASPELERDDRPWVPQRLALSGAFAAIGAWEGPYGLVAAPFLLAMTCLPFVRRERPAMPVCLLWTVAFLAVLLLEPQVVETCSWPALLTFDGLSVSGWIVFLFIGVMPHAVVRRLGENRGTLLAWGLVLLVFAVLAGLSVRFGRQSASERFVRFALGELGERKYIVGDGIFDVMIDEFKPADVRRLGTATVEEREFLLTGFGDGPISNHVLAVRSCYDRFPDMREAAAEVGGQFVPRDESRTNAALTAVWRKSAEDLRQTLEALAQRRADDLPPTLQAQADERIASGLRQGFRDGFAGLGLSSSLLSFDLMAGNRDNLEADAIAVLMSDRDDPAANAVLGSLRLAEGRTDLAERYLKKGVKGGGILAMRDYARLLIARERADEALGWARKAAAKAPEDCEVRKTLTAALIETGDLAAARAEMDELMRLAVRQHLETNAAAFLVGARRQLRQKEKGMRR